MSFRYKSLTEKEKFIVKPLRKSLESFTRGKNKYNLVERKNIVESEENSFSINK